jgi:hypothetical protein
MQVYDYTPPTKEPLRAAGPFLFFSESAKSIAIRNTTPIPPLSKGETRGVKESDEYALTTFFLI